MQKMGHTTAACWACLSQCTSCTCCSILRISSPTSCPCPPPPCSIEPEPPRNVGHETPGSSTRHKTKHSGEGIERKLVPSGFPSITCLATAHLLPQTYAYTNQGSTLQEVECPFAIRRNNLTAKSQSSREHPNLTCWKHLITNSCELTFG